MYQRANTLENEKGFTLVELAIVLVIIGVILGAVMKGQDLLEGARAKKLASTVNTWSSLVWTYVDRLGRFPGDSGRDGLIGNTGAEQTAAASAIGQLSAAGVMANPPENPVLIGGQSFWVYIGNDAVTTGNRNVMVICKAASCATALTGDEVRILQSLDTTIDGRADAGLGQVRGATAVTLVPAAPGTVVNRAATAVTGVTGVNEVDMGAATLWATTQVAAVWLFDKPY